MNFRKIAIGMMLAVAIITLNFSGALANEKANRKEMNTAVPAVAGWYFRAISGYPAAISFEPVVLFKNGEYLEVGEEPIETLDVAASKSSRPRAWGKWKKSGATFYLTDNKGHVSDYKLGEGNWFPAYPYSAAVKLKRGYEKATGGDYGNGTSALVINKINFVDATHFTEGANGGIMTGSAKARKKSSNAGTYRIFGNSIEFNYGGKVVKKSFAIGAEGSPARPSASIIFIGGDPFTDTE
ncbi:hypothetical protein [Mucilaginibacter sp.]|uniref:hypothetical protein n=1 Tax=Mucilaginibacter sp. TaxID=1882438 RepID=UPI0035BC902C